jgi:hypothetical protein
MNRLKVLVAFCAKPRSFVNGREQGRLPETKARLVGSCLNTSAVFGREKDGAYQLVFLQEPTDELMGNGVGLMDWSKYGGA